MVEEIAGARHVVAPEPVQVAVDLVCPGLRNHIDDGAVVAAVLGGKVIGDDPEFLGGVGVQGLKP